MSIVDDTVSITGHATEATGGVKAEDALPLRPGTQVGRYMIIDRIGPTAGIVISKQLRELEQQFEQENAGKAMPSSGENAAATE